MPLLFGGWFERLILDLRDRIVEAFAGKYRNLKSMSIILNRVILMLIFANTVACSDAELQVDFLSNPGLKKNMPPGGTSSNNLSPTEVVTDGNYKIKGRVSVLNSQISLSGGDYKIKGKISFQ